MDALALPNTTERIMQKCRYIEQELAKTPQTQMQGNL